LKQVILFVISLSLSSLPLIIFEVKHHFSQTQSFIQNLHIDQGGGTGLDKFHLLSYKATLNIINLFFAPLNSLFLKDTPLMMVILLSTLTLVRKKLLKLSELIPLYIWIIGVFIFYTFSSTIISEYYLQNYEVIFIMIASFWLF